MMDKHAIIAMLNEMKLFHSFHLVESFFDENKLFLKPRLFFGTASFELCHIVKKHL